MTVATHSSFLDKCPGSIQRQASSEDPLLPRSVLAWRSNAPCTYEHVFFVCRDHRNPPDAGGSCHNVRMDDLRRLTAHMGGCAKGANRRRLSENERLVAHPTNTVHQPTHDDWRDNGGHEPESDHCSDSPSDIDETYASEHITNGGDTFAIPSDHEDNEPPRAFPGTLEGDPDDQRNTTRNTRDPGSAALTSATFELQTYLHSLQHQDAHPAFREAAKLYSFIQQRGTGREKGDMLLQLLPNLDYRELPRSYKTIEAMMARHREATMPHSNDVVVHFPEWYKEAQPSVLAKGSFRPVAHAVRCLLQLLK